MEERSAFGRYVRSTRVEARLSLRDVADRLGVSHVYLGEVERGVRPPLKKERWKALLAAIPGLDRSRLEKLAEVSKPIQLGGGH